MSSTRDGEDDGDTHQEAMEVGMAQMETRLRAMISELLQPTIQRTAGIVADVDVMRNVVAQHTRGLQEVQVGQFKAMEQVGTIASFKEEMAKWNTARHQYEMVVSEKVEEMRQQLEGFRYGLEQKESALHHLNRSVDRAVAELNRCMDEQDEQKLRFESSFDEHSRKLSTSRNEIDVRIAGLELRHNALSDELWGEETGLARAIGELRKTCTICENLEAGMEKLKETKAEAEQLDKLRSEVQRMIAEASKSVGAMELTVGNVVSDVREHFRTASQTIAAHNANFIGEVRQQYTAELARTAKLRHEVEDFMGRVDSNMEKLGARVSEASERADTLASEARCEVEELNRRRKRDRSSSDNEIKAVKDRLSAVFNKTDQGLRGLANIRIVVQYLLDSDLMQCSVEMQDTSDRLKIALLGVKDEETVLGRTTQTEPQKPRDEYRSRSAGLSGGRLQPRGHRGGGNRGGGLSARTAQQEPVVRVDQRCLSCSGQAPLVLSP